MRCPFCGDQDTRVLDSRLASDGEQVRRRRLCILCHARFTTYEVVELNLPQVVKLDGTKVPFNATKLRSGLACALAKRPITNEQIDALINKIVRILFTTSEREVSSRYIGELALKELRHLDPIAYMRFASVYGQFNTIHDFQTTIDRLEQEGIAADGCLQLDLFRYHANDDCD